MLSKVKLAIGYVLIRLLPKEAKQLEDKGMTLIIEDNLSKIERLMRNALLDKVEKEGNYDHLSGLHKNYWKNRGGEYFSLTDNNFETVFLPDCSFLIDELVQQIGPNHNFNQFVEIGTGNGDVLNYCSLTIPGINQYVGIDLSSKQIEVNKKKYKNKNLQFVAADAGEWIPKNGQRNTIYLTSRGVLEYFTEQDLLDLLSTISNMGNSIFVAIEPVGVDHDLDINPHSRLYGGEKSFSHNYKVLFPKAGFSIEYLSEKVYRENDHKLLFIIAKAK